MAKVLIHATMSLDGFIARPNDDIGWAFESGTDQMVTNVMKEVGAVVLGNRGFKEGAVNETTLAYGGRVRVPQLVVAHEPRDPITIGG